MTNSKPITSLGLREAYEPPSPAKELEHDASRTAVTAAGALRAVDVAAAVLVGLLVCPPLAILVFLLVAPFLVVALLVGLLAAVVSTPYLLVQHFRGHHGGHLSLLADRLHRVARALIDLAPHRIVADARELATKGRG